MEAAASPATALLLRLQEAEAHLQEALATLQSDPPTLLQLSGRDAVDRQPSSQTDESAESAQRRRDLGAKLTQHTALAVGLLTQPQQPRAACRTATDRSVAEGDGVGRPRFRCRGRSRRGSRGCGCPEQPAVRGLDRNYRAAR